MKRMGSVGKLSVSPSPGKVGAGASPHAFVNWPVAHGPIPEPPSVAATRQYSVPSGRSVGGVALMLTVSTL